MLILLVGTAGVNLGETSADPGMLAGVALCWYLGYWTNSQDTAD